ncbi:MAG: hypothetical protein QE277_04725 [Flectobacillus sp.]|nr:hypothetical protein [Flectobacillus sp.]
MTAPVIIMIPEQELAQIKTTQQQILEKLQELNVKEASTSIVQYITASEFMEAVRIKRSKFDSLVINNKIQTIKKGRKIYVAKSEVQKYFST